MKVYGNGFVGYVNRVAELASFGRCNSFVCLRYLTGMTSDSTHAHDSCFVRVENDIDDLILIRLISLKESTIDYLKQLKL